MHDDKPLPTHFVTPLSGVVTMGTIPLIERGALSLRSLRANLRHCALCLQVFALKTKIVHQVTGHDNS